MLFSITPHPSLNASISLNQRQPPIFPASTNRYQKYVRNPTKYWNDFYNRHENKFFKDRHYLQKQWGHFFSFNGEINETGKVALEVGCGAGNTIFPLLATFPNLFIHACDFSSPAIALVKAHRAFQADRVSVFLCDVTTDDLSKKLLPFSIDVVTLVFTLSAVSPEKMSSLLQNIKRVLKPNGHVLIRDYAMGDFAQEKLSTKNQMISENFYVRGDGTCAFYFSEDFLSNLFEREGFTTVEVNVRCKKIENRSRKVVMQRRWIQAIFSKLHGCDTQNGP